MTTPDIHKPALAVPRDPAALMARVLADGMITTAMQPIINLQTGAAVGYESLTRPLPESGFTSAIEIFDTAAACNMLWELEALARERSLIAAQELPTGVMLFLNSSPQTFTHPRFISSLESQVRAAEIPPSRIVLEITERTELQATPLLVEHTRQLKSLGYQIAIDDAGAGTSGLNRLMLLRPHWLKLDRELVEHVDQDRYKLNLIRFLVRFARLTGLHILAEGIERDSELKTLVECGVAYGQGYLLGRPQAHVSQLPKEIASKVRTLTSSSLNSASRDPRSSPIEALAHPCISVQATETIAEVASRLLTFAADGGIVVVDGRRCIGWCPLERVLNRSATRHRRDPIGMHVTPSVSTLHPSTTIREALEVAAIRDEEDIASPLIISNNHGEMSIVPVRLLLSAAAASQPESHAGEVSTLTGLPGRVAADMRIEDLLRAEETTPNGAYEAVVVDLRSFSEFNSAAGYDTGDIAIQQLATVLQREISDHIGDSFLAHLGEDRFLIIAPGPALRSRLLAFAALYGDPELATDAIARIGPVGATAYPKLAPRVLLLGQLLGRVTHPRALYQLEAQLRQRSRSIEAVTADTAAVIVSDARSGEAALRASA